MAVSEKGGFDDFETTSEVSEAGLSLSGLSGISTSISGFGRGRISSSKPSLFLMGPKRSGKTSIERVIFHRMDPHQTLYQVNATREVRLTTVQCPRSNPFLSLQLFDFPGLYDVGPHPTAMSEAASSSRMTSDDPSSTLASEMLSSSRLTSDRSSTKSGLRSPQGLSALWKHCDVLALVLDAGSDELRTALRYCAKCLVSLFAALVAQLPPSTSFDAAISSLKERVPLVVLILNRIDSAPSMHRPDSRFRLIRDVECELRELIRDELVRFISSAMHLSSSMTSAYYDDIPASSTSLRTGASSSSASSSSSSADESGSRVGGGGGASSSSRSGGVGGLNGTLSLLTEELIDSLLMVNYYLTSIYDYSVFECMSRVLSMLHQRCVGQWKEKSPIFLELSSDLSRAAILYHSLEQGLKKLASKSSIDKCVVFDMRYKLYVCSDTTSSDGDGGMVAVGGELLGDRRLAVTSFDTLVALSSDMIEIVTTVSEIYSLTHGLGREMDAQITLGMNDGGPFEDSGPFGLSSDVGQSGQGSFPLNRMILRPISGSLALVCLIASSMTTDTRGLVEHNIDCFVKGARKMIECAGKYSLEDSHG